MKKKENGEKYKSHAVTVGVVGAVVGSAVGLALSNKKTRTKIADMLSDTKDATINTFKDVKNKAKEVKEEFSDNVEEAKVMAAKA